MHNAYECGVMEVGKSRQENQNPFIFISFSDRIHAGLHNDVHCGINFNFFSSPISNAQQEGKGVSVSMHG